MQRTRRGRGFTLIELLVVIAIIAILAGILFPAFARARHRALQTKCLSNLRQLVMAMGMYVTEFGQIPEDPWTLAWLESNWPESIQPHTGSREILRCPAAPRESPPVAADYSLNSIVIGSLPGVAVVSSSETIVLAERARGVREPFYRPWETGPPVSAVVRFAASLDPARHGEGSNYGFADGHARWLAWDQTLHPNNLHDPRDDPY